MIVCQGIDKGFFVLGKLRGLCCWNIKSENSKGQIVEVYCVMLRSMDFILQESGSLCFVELNRRMVFIVRLLWVYVFYWLRRVLNFIVVFFGLFILVVSLYLCRFGFIWSQRSRCGQLYCGFIVDFKMYCRYFFWRMDVFQVMLKEVIWRGVLVDGKLCLEKVEVRFRRQQDYFIIYFFIQV